MMRNETHLSNTEGMLVESKAATINTDEYLQKRDKMIYF